MKQRLLFFMLFFTIINFAQVSLVKDINVGGGSSLPVYGFEHAVINNKLIFAASTPTSNNYNAVWVSDGTESGTNLIHQLVPSGDAFAQDFYFSTVLNKVIFMGNMGASNTFSVLTTDGTSSSLLNLSVGRYAFLTAPNNNQNPQGFIDFNGKVFFNLHELSLNTGPELFSTDGTFQGTELFKELYTGIFGGNPTDFTVYNNKLYFVANDGTNGFELWVTDGTVSGTTLFLDIYPGASNFNSIPASLTVFNNKLYFTADNGTNGRELWTTDGTVTGTYMVLDLNTGSTGSNPTNLLVYNNALYFTATHPTLGNEVFKMTTSETITNLKNINTGSASSSPSNLYAFNNELYFAADDGSGTELWKSGGFNANTNKLMDINPSGASNPDNFQIYNGKLYFVADNGTNGRELWVTDGTSTNTTMVSDIFSGPNSSNPKTLVVANNLLFFAAQNQLSGIELFKYQDPTLAINNFNYLEKNITLFPNTAKQYFKIDTTEKISEVNIYSSLGKLVKTFVSQDTYLISELSKGVYFVRIKIQEKSVIKKLIKE